MKMKCGCIWNNGPQRLMNYERYNKLPTLAEFGVELEDKFNSNENEEELVFYNENDTYQTVVVVQKLRASDLCQILAMKNRVRKDCHWSIVEHWIDVGLERMVEDHEDILQTYKHMESYPKPVAKRFLFKKNYEKYEVFMNPQKFFLSEMVDLSSGGFPGAAVEDAMSPQSLQAMVEEGDSCPPMFGHVWVRDSSSLLWAKAYLLLKERKLYLSYKLREEHKQSSDWNQLKLFARISESTAYKTLNAKKELRAPTDFGICIRTTDTEDEPSYIGDITSDLRCIACETEKSRSCWMVAMRLAKYGKQLRDNYRAFKNKQNLGDNKSPILSRCESKEYTKHSVPCIRSYFSISP